jgi:hypothetical protein
MAGEPRSESAPSGPSRAAAGLFAVVALAFLATMFRRGLAYPTPWPDEGSFLWPTLAFRDGFSLFAPELHSTREVMWMPPGFMVLEGTIFRILPFSLSLSRLLSALAICGAFAAVLSMVRTSRALAGHVLAASPLLFAPIVLLAGNVARMEGLVLLVTSLGFFYLSERRSAGLALLALAPLFHPNGAFPLAFGAVYWLFNLRKERLTRGDWAWMSVVAVAWVAYGVHVSMHFQDFLADMGAQIKFKRFVSAGEAGGFAGRLSQPMVVAPAAVLVASVVAARRIGARVGALATFSASLFVQTLTAAGWLYEVYPVWAILLASMVGLEVASEAIVRRGLSGRASVAALAAASVALAALNALVVARNPFLARSLERAVVDRDSWSPTYFTKADHDAVEKKLLGIPRDVPRSVQFIPDADGLLFEKVRGPNFRFVEHTFFDFVPDVLVVHDSVWLPRWLRDLQLLKTFSMHPGKGPIEAQVIRSRDGTERWTMYRWR